MVVLAFDAFDTEVILGNEKLPASHLWAGTIVDICENAMIFLEYKVSVSQKILVLLNM